MSRSLPDVAADWTAAMRRGDWEAAWCATDRIEVLRRAWQQQPGFERRPEFLCWDGTPTAGRSVLVRCDHGLGDTLQFLRFVPLLGARDVAFMVQPPLLPLLEGAEGLGTVRNWWTDDPLPPHEVQVEVMELPYVLRTTLATLPPPYPLAAHLAGDAQFILPPDDGRLRVGLLWSASDWDPSRTLPLRALAPLFAVEGVRFFSLQQGDAAGDPLLAKVPIEVLSPKTTDVRSAAAAMLALDLVVCVDGMPAHLAGTLRRPTWLLLKRDADWRWMDERSDSPWYPTMRLFRQRTGDWGQVVGEVAAALAVHAGGASRSAGVAARTQPTKAGAPGAWAP